MKRITKILLSVISVVVLSVFLMSTIVLAATLLTTNTSIYSSLVTLDSGSTNTRHIAVSSTGRIWVATLVYDVTDTYGCVKVHYSDDGGATWNSSLTLTGDINNDYYAPCLAIDSNNILYLAYTKTDTATSISTVCSKPYDGAWEAERVVNDVAVYFSTTPSIAIDSLNRVHIVYGAKWNSGGTDYPNIRYATELTHNNAWAGSTWLSNIALAAGQISPTIQVGPNNRLHVAWDGYGWGAFVGDYTAVYAYNDGTWHTEQIYDVDGEAWGVSLAVDSSNNVYAAWDQRESFPAKQYTAYAKRTFGIGWGTVEEAITLTDSGTASITLDRHTIPTIVVQSEDGVHYHIVWSRRTAGTWTAPVQVDAAEAGSPSVMFAYYPLVAGVPSHVLTDGFYGVYTDDDANDIMFSFQYLNSGPTNLVADPTNSSTIKLTWVKDTDYPTTAIYCKQTGYPTSPTDANAILVCTSVLQTYFHSGLTVGATYYYRAWSVISTGVYSNNYAEDYATTDFSPTAGILPSINEEEIVQPSDWFQTPVCTAYVNLPLVYPLIQNLTTAFGMPEVTGCVILTFGWILVGSVVVRQITHTTLMALVAVFIGIGIATAAQLLPSLFWAIEFVLGGLLIYVWRRQ